MYNTIYPAYIRPYQGLQQKQITRKQDDEKNSQSSKQTENNPEQERKQSNHQSYFPNGEKVAIDYTRRQIGIEQVLTDFKNTTNAIGAPDDIKAEVDSYLSLVESQAQKNNPNAQIIQSNLKNASQILDEYITNTLKKPSKVVENWVDALFLQQINYKAEPKEIVNETTLISEASAPQNEIQDIKEEDSTDKVQSQTDIYVPSDENLKRMFIQAKKYSAIDEKEKALYAFQKVMDYALNVGDEQACAMVHYEQARIYDDFDKINDALYNYDKAARQSNNNNIKAKSHIYMGKIYDDYVKLNPAIDHYSAAVSYAGEADNIMLQTKALANLAQIHTEKYDKDAALMFMDFSDIMAEETDNPKLKARISSQNAYNCSRLKENLRALKYHGKSAKYFALSDENENLAKEYLEAAEIMIKYGNKAKAKKLLGKAYIALQGGLNPELREEIIQKLNLI